MAGTKSLPTYSALYAFGDSLSDAGNDYILTTSQGDPALPVSPPYHAERYGSVTGTTFSNDAPWVQLLSIDLGLGTLAPSLANGRASNAYDFAYGGAQTGSTQYNRESTQERIINLDTQISQFKVQVQAPAANALYTLSMGANDLIALLFNPSLTTSERNAGVVQAVANEVGFISRLIGGGGTHFVILNVPDLGYTPLGRDGANHGGYTAAEASALAATYDSQLASQIAPLASSGVDIHILDGYGLIDAAVANPAAYGVTNARDPVWTGSFDNPNSGTLVSSDPAVQNQYLFFDLIHPTHTGHLAIAGLAEASLTAGPVRPFAAITVSDTAATAILTVAVKLVPVTAGAFSSFGRGSFDAATGIYTTTGTAAAVTADLQGVQFLPSVAAATFGWDATLTGSMTAQLVDTGAGPNVLRLATPGATAIAGGGADTIYGGPGANVLVGGTGGGTLLGGTGSGTFFATGGSTVIVGNGARDVVSAAVGNVTITTSAGGHSVLGLGTGTAIVNGQGADTLVAGSGGVSGGIGTGSAAFLGSGSATISAAQGSTVVGGSGSAIVGVRGTGVQLFGGAGPFTFIGGTGSSTVVGGAGGNGIVFAGQGGGVFAGGVAGNNILVGGLQATTLFGGGGGDVLFASGAAGTVLSAGSGNETLQGGSSSGNDTFFAGSGTTLIGLGTGNDAVYAGTGASTVVGGSGANTFAFISGRAGGTESIIGFKSGIDRLLLQGYAANEAARAVSTATSTSGRGGAPPATTITLSDNTRITFLGNASLPANPFN